MTPTDPRRHAVTVAARAALWLTGRVDAFVSTVADTVVWRDAISIFAPNTRRLTYPIVFSSAVSYAADAFVVCYTGAVHTGGLTDWDTIVRVVWVGLVAVVTFTFVGFCTFSVDADVVTDWNASAV